MSLILSVQSAKIIRQISFYNHGLKWKEKGAYREASFLMKVSNTPNNNQITIIFCIYHAWWTDNHAGSSDDLQVTWRTPFWYTNKYLHLSCFSIYLFGSHQRSEYSNCVYLFNLRFSFDLICTGLYRQKYVLTLF